MMLKLKLIHLGENKKDIIFRGGITSISRQPYPFVDTTGNIFSFETIRFGAADLNETRVTNLLSLQDGSEAGSTLHTHDDIYFRETEISATTALSGSTCR